MLSLLPSPSITEAEVSEPILIFENSMELRMIACWVEAMLVSGFSMLS